MTRQDELYRGRQQTASGPVETDPGSTRDAARLGTGAGVVLCALVAGRGIKLLTRVAIARLLGAVTLGVFDLAWTLVLLLTHVVRGGLQMAVVRFGTPLWGRDALSTVIRRSVAVPLLLGGVVAGALIMTAPWMAAEVFRVPEVAHAIRVLALLVPLTAGLQVLAAVTQLSKQMRYTALVRDLAEPCLQAALFLLLFACGLRLAAALWGTLVAGLIAFVLAMFVVRHLRPAVVPEPPSAAPAAPGWRELLSYSLPVALSGMIMAYLMWVDRLLVGYFGTARDVGVYGAAAQFGILFTMLLHGFNTVFTPMFADLASRGERRRMTELYRVTTKWGLYLLMPLIVVFAMLPHLALSGLFGREFAEGGRALQILLIGQLVNAVSGPVGMILILLGRERVWLALSAGALTLNVVLDVLWLPRFGIEGAAGASAVAALLLFGGGILAVRRGFGIWPVDGRMWKLLPSVLAALAGIVMLRELDIPASPMILVLAIVVAFVLSGGVRLLLPFDPEDRALFSVVREKVSGGRRG